MEAKWLEDFLSVARTGSFSLSATERHITQSAFSRRIKSLEQWVGVALIDRSSYPTRLTAAGQRFQAAAREATASLLNVRQELRQAARADRRLLRIAIQHSLASSFLARWLATLPLDRDDLLTQVRADNLHDCVRDLEEGGVDLLVCYTHPGLPLELSAERYPSVTLAQDVLTPVSHARRRRPSDARPAARCCGRGSLAELQRRRSTGPDSGAGARYGRAAAGRAPCVRERPGRSPARHGVGRDGCGLAARQPDRR